MKWLLTGVRNEVHVYPEKDILPHTMSINCPCRAALIYMQKGDIMLLELEDVNEKFVANDHLTMSLHVGVLEKLKNSDN